MDKFDAKRNLIVNYLPNTLTEDEVLKMFEAIGSVSSCKLILNKTTGESLGYAFVEYADEESAKKAIDEITGTQLNGKTLKVSLARPPSAEDVKNANVYIAGLPGTLPEDELLSLFSSYGTVLSHKILTNADGTSRGAGFVRFSSNSEAAKAIKEMANTTLPNAVGPLTVKLAIPPASKDNLNSLNAITTSTLAGLGVASRNANVRFNPMAASNQLLVNGTPTSAVAAALSGMNAHLAQNASVAQLQQQPASVYVFGLQPTHTELTLYELFSPFGAILNVKLIRDLTKEGKPCKGYGFVNFSKADDATRAVGSMHGVQFEERVLQVSFKQNKNQQQQQQQIQVQHGQQGQHAQLSQHYASLGVMGIPGINVGIPA